MKNILLALSAIILLQLCGCGGGGGGQAPQATQARPAAEYFTIVALPDTQIYSHQYQEIFESQTQWIADNSAAENIAFVLHEGDIVNLPAPGDRQWNNASAAMRTLDAAGIPYALAVGNHDYQDHAATRDSSGFNRAYPVSRYPKAVTLEPDKMDNAYHTFAAGGSHWLVMALEYGPRAGVLEWANKVIAGAPEYHVIILTHAYLDYDGSLIGQKPTHPTPHKDGIYTQPGGAADGLEMWNKLIRYHANIAMVVSGHISGDGLARRADPGDHGNTVISMAANYQYAENGGNGFLRLIRIYENGDVKVLTYSPWLDEYKRDSENEFEYHSPELDARQTITAKSKKRK